MFVEPHRLPWQPCVVINLKQVNIVTMWNFVNSLGINHHNCPLLGAPAGGAAAAQKRNFSLLNFANVSIAPGKCFTNPNFVNNHQRNVHNVFQVDSTKSTSSSSGRNSSPVNVPSFEDETTKVDKMSFNNNTKRRSKKNRRKRRKKSSSSSAHKNHQNHNKPNNGINKKDIEEMMEIGTNQSDICMASPDTTSALHSLCLSDFLVNESVISSSPLNYCPLGSVASKYFCPRPRKLSTTESEDSFIIFDSGTDERDGATDELDSESCYSDDTDSEETHTDVEELDSSRPTKKVKFADDNELCEVHLMVKWSFAYQQARMGPWEKYARDRDRFNKRINETERILLPIFDTDHRDKVFKERFQQ